MSVVGFDDTPLAGWLAFSLTTFSCPLAAMANRVVAVML
jgi:DNA-binding LacI/PurR family transcriptional regulator